MNLDPEDPNALALQRFRERAGYYCEQFAADYDNLDSEDWPTVIAREAAILAQRGPAGYLQHVAGLNDAAVLVDLDRELQRIFARPF